MISILIAQTQAIGALVGQISAQNGIKVEPYKPTWKDRFIDFVVGAIFVVETVLVAAAGVGFFVGLGLLMRLSK